MPCIQITTNKTITKEKECILKARLGEAIAILPRKSEQWLMCVFRSDCDMWFQGSQGDMALVEVDVFGKLDHEPCSALTAALTEILEQELGIAGDKSYIKYSATPEWGWNGKNF